MEMISQLDEELKPRRGIEFKLKGRLTPIYSDEQMLSASILLEVSKKLSIQTERIKPEEVKEICPLVKTEGALAFIYNLPSTHGLANPLATTFALADRAKQMGVKICLETEVIGLETSGGRISTVITNRGKINAPFVINATGPYAYLISGMLGLHHPVGPARRQIAITEPIEPLLDIYLGYIGAGTYICQLPKGGIVIGSPNPEEPIGINYSHDINFLLRVARQASHLVPALKDVRIVRQWAGHVSISKDGDPILGSVEEVNGYFLALGCAKGFTLSLIMGKLMAELLSGEETSLPICDLNAARFKDGKKHQVYVGIY
jgi:sarcosine oxidase subunit beta